MKSLLLSIYFPCIFVLAGSSGAPGILSTPDLRVFLLLGALIGGLGAALTVAPGDSTRGALLKWTVAFSFSVALTPGVVNFLKLPLEPDTVFSVAAVISLLSWLIVKVLRSLSVEDLKGFLKRLLNLNQ